MQPHYHGEREMGGLAITCIIAEMTRKVNNVFLRAVLGIATGEILLNVKMQGRRTGLPCIFASFC